jgi:hypothetical protein
MPINARMRKYFVIFTGLADYVDETFQFRMITPMVKEVIVYSIRKFFIALVDCIPVIQVVAAFVHNLALIINNC